MPREALRVAVAGLPGVDKTTLVQALMEAMREKYDVAVVSLEEAARADLQRDIVFVECEGRAIREAPFDLTICFAPAKQLAPSSEGVLENCDLLVIDDVGSTAQSRMSIAAVAKKLRASRPFAFVDLDARDGLQPVIDFIETDGLLDETTPDG